MVRPMKLAIVVSHPIQHFVHFYRALAAHPEVDLTVLFGAPIGLKSYFDKEMNTEIAWAMDMLSGYDHKILEPDQVHIQPGLRAPNAPALGRELSALQPDVVLIYGYAQINAARALWWCNRHSVPALMIGDSELRRQRSSIKTMVKRLAMPLVLGRYSAFLSVGDCGEDYYRAYGVAKDKIFRSPFTIDESAYKAARTNRTAMRAAVRTEYNIGENDFVTLFVGKLSQRKRPNDLLDAVTDLARRSGEQRHVALFAGNGEEMAAMEARIAQENLPARLAGFVNVDRLPALYAAADVLAHPSGADPHPLVCSEAACMGLPMVLSDRVGAAGPTDIARDGDNAIVVPVGDVHALADALDKIGSDSDLFKRMAGRSLEIYDELDIRRSVGGIVDAMKFVCARQSSKSGNGKLAA